MDSRSNRFSFLGTRCASATLVLSLCSGLATASTSLIALDPDLNERWLEPALLSVKRTDASQAQSFSVTYSGTAGRGSDYSASAVGTLLFPVGVKEQIIALTPLNDRVREQAETIIVQVDGQTATVRINDFTEIPTVSEATRFLQQAAFGADQLTLNEVRKLGFKGWLDAQTKRPKGYTQPAITAKRLAGLPVYHTETKIALWEQVMKQNQADPLRQRIAYSLLQIFVISQNPDVLSNNSEGVANYYDRLLDGSLGNFRNLLYDVIKHPCMGSYLSHLGNRKADPLVNRFPDENFAREVMQLFTIGLWELNEDGSRVLVDGQPVPTYNNETIGNYARVFTGYNFGGPTNSSFYWPEWTFLHPMKVWDEEHDMAPKTLLSGITTPQRTFNPNSPSLGAEKDLDLAINSLFLHPNVGPFIGRLLIQRLVTSNPSPAYITRVSRAFADNGKGIRGDMSAVVRAILLDPEARGYQSTLGDTKGKKREPYMSLFNLAKPFDAKAPNGKWDNVTYMYQFMNQEVFGSPSVFNFYLPNYRPSGAMTTQNLYGPEFQIVTAVTAHGALNILYQMIYWDLSAWGSEPEWAIKMKTDSFLPLAANPDTLVHALAARVLDRRLSARTSQIIRNAVSKIETTEWEWQRERVNMALYLLVSSTDFQIQK